MCVIPTDPTVTCFMIHGQVPPRVFCVRLRRALYKCVLRMLSLTLQVTRRMLPSMTPRTKKNNKKKTMVPLLFRILKVSIQEVRANGRQRKTFNERGSDNAQLLLALPLSNLNSRFVHAIAKQHDVVMPRHMQRGSNSVRRVCIQMP